MLCTNAINLANSEYCERKVDELRGELSHICVRAVFRGNWVDGCGEAWREGEGTHSSVYEQLGVRYPVWQC